MNSEQLREILSKNNLKDMENALLARGFVVVRKDKELSQLLMTDILFAKKIADIEYGDTGKYVYTGALYLNVIGHEDLTFVWIEQLKKIGGVYAPDKVLVMAGKGE